MYKAKKKKKSIIQSLGIFCNGIWPSPFAKLEGTDGAEFKKNPFSGNVFIACIVSFEFCAPVCIISFFFSYLAVISWAYEMGNMSGIIRPYSAETSVDKLPLLQKQLITCRPVNFAQQRPSVCSHLFPEEQFLFHEDCSMMSKHLPL